MKDETKEQLINELKGMRQRVAKLEASEAERKQAEKALRVSEDKNTEPSLKASKMDTMRLTLPVTLPSSMIRCVR